ncbi:hypothetical protein [Saccharibacillus sp. JS10]|uniref:hypothetical protein n=1 Tax=Saccharibacillus sp. JS10 TaxID=2950552 RepID=UPI0021086D3C|nr:hypothetical protein [Saccharibacillus sp. JS10]MCQ4087888.1 hypothetical protein [Saccharibacillus sp. JS10]
MIAPLILMVITVASYLLMNFFVKAMRPDVQKGLVTAISVCFAVLVLALFATLFLLIYGMEVLAGRLA